ncbi:hypothetical protein D6833_12390 [Candidatus Parcubacteria bacterium]|nr:MAG: hypothetical protein D6833_12390 [Candidatus Parcubacteria bacterium]
MSATHSLLLALVVGLLFVSCDSGTLLSPADDSAGGLPKAAAPATAVVTVQSNGGALTWQIDLEVQGANRSKLAGQGVMTIITPDAALALGKNAAGTPGTEGIIFVPIGGRVQLRQLRNGQFSVRLLARSSSRTEQVRLRFRGAGTGDPATQSITGTGQTRGRISVQGFKGTLNGPAQIRIDFTGAG